MPRPEDSMEEHDRKCGCLAMSKLRELTKAGPPRPGLVPQSGDPEHPGRWVRPEDGVEGADAIEKPVLTPKVKGWADNWLQQEQQVGGEIGNYGWESAFRDLTHDIKSLRQGEAQSIPEVQVLADDLDSYRKWLAQRAADKGRSVPAEILAEYPDLAGGKMMKTQVIQGLEKLIKVGPPRPGLVPQSGDPEHPGRWVRPEDAQGSEGARVSVPSGAPKQPWQMTGGEWRDIPMEEQDKIPALDTGARPYNTNYHFLQVRQAIRDGLPVPQKVIESFGPHNRMRADGRRMLEIEIERRGQRSVEGKMMKADVTQALGSLVKGLELKGLTVGLNGLIAKGACPIDAVPLEQIKGDLARAGHPVKRAIALDAENRRLFFIDNTDTYLFAEYGSPEVGFSLGRVGSQSEVAKDYDPVDLEPEPRSDVKVEHDEEGQGDDPGFVPSGTPGVKPIDADGRGFGKELKASLDKVCGCLKDQGR